MKVFITTMALMLTLGAITASAATLMSYSGTGIWDKYSVGTFSLNDSSNSVTIRHTTSSHSGGNQLKIGVCKQNWLGQYSQQDDHYVAGTGTWNLNSSGLPSGVYKLRFQRTATAGDFDISGSVSN